jgi:histidinol phosphatase-like PHP family hydrolase
MRRASRRALSWTVEACELARRGDSLMTLPGVGRWLSGVIATWVQEGVEAPPADPLRSGFLTRTQTDRILAAAQSWRDVVRADLQMHTLMTDGHASLETMARECMALGYTHLAVTDHSEGLRIAGGMDAATLARQAVEVRTLNAQLAADGAAFRVLHGIEMNLSPEGIGDTDPAVLATLDIVLGAFHSKLRLRDDQTDRYIRALRNPNVDVLAHPRGRIYNHRVGLDARWDLVFEAAAEHGVALEIDSYVDRQDLDVELLRLAARYEVWIAVDTDAHHPVDLLSMPFGVAALVLAGIDPARVINAMAPDELEEWVQHRRARAAARSQVV